MRTLQELRALGLLVVRSWYRIGPRVRGGRKPEPTRGVSAVLMRLVFAALIYNFGFTSGSTIARSAQPTWAATWAGVGAGLFVLATTFALELPSPRTPTQALKSELLELLPLSRLSKLLLTLAQSLLMLPLTVGLAVTLRSELSPDASLLGAVALGVGLFSCFALVGSSAGKLLKLALSPYAASRVSWLSAVPMLVGLLLLQSGQARSWLPRPFFGEALGEALAGDGTWRVTFVIYASTGLLGLAFFRLESRHELAEPVRPGSTRSALSAGADIARVERLLGRREPGGTLQAPLVTFMSAVFIGVAAWTHEPREPTARLGLVWNVGALLTLQLVSSLGMQRATRAATRDTLARPLLGALPITPRDTLGSKARALRLTLLIVAAPLLLSLLVLRRQPAAFAELAWRLPTAFLAVGVYASAAVYVAFLTAGLGAVRPRGGVFGSLESFLLAVPFASVLFALGPGSALLSLVTLGALTFEARRAALGTVHWLDDPEREHSTEVWKALVVFGGFQGAQLLSQQVASLFGSWLSASFQLLGAYVLSATALWAMTRREQEAGIPELRWRLAPLGLAIGAISCALAWVYLNLIEPSADGARGLSVSGPTELGLAALAIVVAAPLVEERFFRGWLQPALESVLGPRRRWAPALSALAFAIAHPAYSFVPVLALGLLNGFALQRFRSLAACVVAHAVHNAFALWLGSR
jgi:membrane protease YdiL (CAAX protease family)